MSPGAMDAPVPPELRGVLAAIAGERQSSS